MAGTIKKYDTVWPAVFIKMLRIPRNARTEGYPVTAAVGCQRQGAIVDSIDT